MLDFGGWHFLDQPLCLSQGGASSKSEETLGVPASCLRVSVWLLLMHKLDVSPNDLRPQQLKPDRLWGLTHLLVMMPLWGEGAVILFIKIFLMFNLHFIRLRLILPLQQFSWAKESIY